MRHKTPWYSLAPVIKKARSILHPEPKLPWEAQVFRQAHSFIDPLQLNNRFNDSWNKYHKEDYNLRKELAAYKEAEANKYRKAIATTSIYPNIFGVFREGFNRYENDRLAQNPTYALCEKSIQDYVSTLEWTVKNRDKNKVPDAIDFLEYPNKQDTLNDILGETCRDVTRYDAGVWAKTLDQKDELIDFKAYYGPEFWIGIDRNLQSVKTEAGTLEGWWSHGYAEKYWQHSRQGIFLEFEPDEISYFMMYPRSDSPYGTDFIMHLRWYLEMLLDSTKAAGMLFANGVNPGTIWRHPELTSFQELQERKTEIELSLQGPENFGGVLHLIGEEELQQLTPTMVDMQWLQGQKFISEIVWAMFGFSPADFGSGDMNRATAYIQTNVTKSRMLFPLITLFQTRINRDILPFLPGYEKGWKFEFIPSVSLDDDQKRAGIKQTRSGTFATLLQTGVPADLAAKYAEITDDLSPDDIKRLKDTQQQQQSYQQDSDDYPDGAGMEGDPESYDGTDTGPAMQQVSQPIQKASKQQRLDIFLHFDADNNNEIKKSRVYLKPGEKPPKGMIVKRGPKEGYYYDANSEKPLKHKAAVYYDTKSKSPGHAYAEIGKKRVLENLNPSLNDRHVNYFKEHNKNPEEIKQFTQNIEEIHTRIKSLLEQDNGKKSVKQLTQDVSDITSDVIKREYGEEWGFATEIMNYLENSNNSEKWNKHPKRDTYPRIGSIQPDRGFTGILQHLNERSFGEKRKPKSKPRKKLDADEGIVKHSDRYYENRNDGSSIKQAERIRYTKNDPERSLHSDSNSVNIRRNPRKKS